MKKKRKPRTTSKDLCTGCLGVGCDPMNKNPIVSRKLEYRKKNGLCLGCGQKKCSCKSSHNSKE